MMFFKAAFALYLAAIAIAAPPPQGRPAGDVGSGADGNGNGTFRLNLCLVCTSLSTADMSVIGVGGVLNDSPIDIDV